MCLWIGICSVRLRDHAGAANRDPGDHIAVRRGGAVRHFHLDIGSVQYFLAIQSADHGEGELVPSRERNHALSFELFAHGKSATGHIARIDGRIVGVLRQHHGSGLAGGGIGIRVESGIRPGCLLGEAIRSFPEGNGVSGRVGSPQIRESVGTLGVCLRAERDRIAQVVGALQTDLHPGHGRLIRSVELVLDPVAVDIQPGAVTDAAAHHSFRAGNRPDRELETRCPGECLVGVDVSLSVPDPSHGDVELEDFTRPEGTRLDHSKGSDLGGCGRAGTRAVHHSASRRGVAPHGASRCGIAGVIRILIDLTDRGVENPCCRCSLGDGSRLELEGSGELRLGDIRQTARDIVAGKNINDVRIFHGVSLGTGQRVGQAYPPLVRLVGGLARQVHLSYGSESCFLQLDPGQVRGDDLRLIGTLCQGRCVVLGPDHDVVDIRTVDRGRGDLGGDDDGLQGLVHLMAGEHPPQVGLPLVAGRTFGISRGGSLGDHGRADRGGGESSGCGKAVLHPHVLQNAGNLGRRGQGSSELKLGGVASCHLRRNRAELARGPLANLLVHPDLSGCQDETVPVLTGVVRRVIAGTPPSRLVIQEFLSGQFRHVDPFHTGPVRQDVASGAARVNHLVTDGHNHPDPDTNRLIVGDGFGQHRVDTHSGNRGIDPPGQQIRIIARDSGRIVVPRSLGLATLRGLTVAPGHRGVLNLDAGHLGGFRRVDGTAVHQGIVVAGNPYRCASGSNPLEMSVGVGAGRDVPGLKAQA